MSDNKDMKRKKLQSRGTLTPLNDMFRYDDAANFLGVSVRTLKRWVGAGTVPCYKIGRKVYFGREQLFQHIESCIQEAEK